MRPTFRLLAMAGLFGLAGAAAARADEPLQAYEESQAHMGTRFTIKLYAASEAQAERAMAAAFARIGELDRRLSDYRADSDVSRLSAAAPTSEPVAISDDLRTVLASALLMSRLTDGAFDVTVGPLTKLWRAARKQRALPAEDQLEAARNAVGYQHLQLDDRGRATLRRPRMRIDLGGIAKGYALDEALAALRREGVGRALVDGGGDVAVSDPPPGRDGWRIGVAPLQPGDPPSRVLELANQASATSGDAWQFVELGGKRYSHIVDPRTGLGVVRRCSATVVAPSGMEADALASALCVAGPRGLRFVQQTPQAAALLITAADGDVEEHLSPRFREQFGKR